MAFNRANTSQTSTFSRSGLVSQTINTPDFSTFRVDTTKTRYGLGPNWSIEINSTENTLSFKHNNFSSLTLTSSGFQLSSFVLPSVSNLPSNPDEGTLVNHNDEFKIYI